MKAERLIVRRINKRTHSLPDDVKNETIVLFRTDKQRRVEERQFFHVYPELCPFVPGFTHYVVLPTHLR